MAARGPGRVARGPRRVLEAARQYLLSIARQEFDPDLRAQEQSLGRGPGDVRRGPARLRPIPGRHGSRVARLAAAVAPAPGGQAPPAVPRHPEAAAGPRGGPGRRRLVRRPGRGAGGEHALAQRPGDGARGGPGPPGGPRAAARGLPAGHHPAVPGAAPLRGDRRTVAALAGRRPEALARAVERLHEELDPPP